MVYCGKPSMGCRTCRARRIKCDETRPVCNQCTKSRRHCSGYRSDFDILHRDETQATANRAKRAAAKKAAKRAAENGGAIIQFDPSPAPVSASSSASTSPSVSASSVAPISAPPSNQVKREQSPGHESSTSSPTTSLISPASYSSSNQMGFLIAPPAVPIDQHASHYFASHFIMLPGHGGQSVGHLDYLVPLLNSETNPNSPLQLAYSACGLAAMSNRERAVSTDLTELSFMQHSRAMRAMQKALADPIQSKSDATLATVILLSFFEKITATKEMGLLAWRTHIEGAIHIVSQRGRDMFQTRSSIQLFNAVRLQIIARTLSSGTSPAMGVNWWLPEAENCDPFGARFQRFSLEVSDLRAEVTRLMGILSRNNDGLDIMLEMLRKCQDMDSRIGSWLEHLPAENQPIPLYWDDSVIPREQIKYSAVFPGRVDGYRDIITASLWNGTRATRIILGSLIVRVAAWICSPADYRSTPEYATALRIIKTSISDVISSVPFMLSTLTVDSSSGQDALAGNFLCGADQQAKMVGGLMVSWPLSTIKTCDFTTDEQREWTVSRLQFVAQDLGIRYANSLADVKIRFPSMLMRRDGLMPSQDPLKDLKETGFTRTIPIR